jgi:hypothetical protein
MRRPKPPVEAEHAAVQAAELLLHGAVLHDDELPVLLVRARRRLERELDQAQHERVVDGIGFEATDRPLRPHRLFQRHGEIHAPTQSMRRSAVPNVPWVEHLG